MARQVQEPPPILPAVAFVGALLLGLLLPVVIAIGVTFAKGAGVAVPVASGIWFVVVVGTLIALRRARSE